MKSYKKLFTTGLIQASMSKRPNFVNYLKELGFVQFADNPSQLWANIYAHIFDCFRYEYIFKNEILKMFYSDIMRNNKTLLNEVELMQDGIVHNILDLLLITGGEAHAIEIKSDFDTFQRLDNQLPMYSKLFQYVSVFVSEDKVNSLINYIDNIGFNNVGIIALCDTRIETIRSPKDNSTIIDKQLLLDNINNPIFSYSMLNSIGIEELYSIWIGELKNKATVDVGFINAMPDALKFYAFSHRPTPLKRSRFIKYFNNQRNILYQPTQYSE